MKSGNVIFEKYEETFYFKISRAFWHLLLIVSSLALVVGALLLIWGITPSFLRHVKKPNYPPPVKVTADEVKRQMSPQPLTDSFAPAASEGVQPKPTALSNNESMEYQSALDSLKKLLPSPKFTWKTRGHWTQVWWQKQWVVDAVGIQDQMDSLYSAISASDFSSKTKVLNAFIDLISAYPVEQRGMAFRVALAVSRESVETAVLNIALMKTTATVIGPSNSADLVPAANCIVSDPHNGVPLIQYVYKVLLKFDTGIRKEVFATMLNTYVGDFKNNLDALIEATNLSLDMIGGFSPAEQNKALLEYYRLYQKENYARSQQIAQMDVAYKNELAAAQADLAIKKVKKSGYFTFGWYGIVGGVISIAFVALFLVLLSIQRNIKMIREVSNSPGNGEPKKTGI